MNYEFRSSPQPQRVGRHFNRSALPPLAGMAAGSTDTRPGLAQALRTIAACDRLPATAPSGRTESPMELAPQSDGISNRRPCQSVETAQRYTSGHLHPASQNTCLREPRSPHSRDQDKRASDPTRERTSQPSPHSRHQTVLNTRRLDIPARPCHTARLVWIRDQRPGWNDPRAGDTGLAGLPPYEA